MNLKEFMFESAIMTKDLALMLGVSQATLVKILSGKIGRERTQYVINKHMKKLIGEGKLPDDITIT